MKFMHKSLIPAFAASLLFLAGAALPVRAAAPVIYPAKGQTADQQHQDQAQCHQWAVETTGIDPANLPQPSSAPVAQNGRPVLRGAAAGAAVGGLGGSLGGEFGKGAAAGALVGAVAGGVRRHRNQAAAQSSQAQARQQHEQMLQQYNRAYGACLEGRGYTVK